MKGPKYRFQIVKVRDSEERDNGWRIREVTVNAGGTEEKVRDSEECLRDSGRILTVIIIILIIIITKIIIIKNINFKNNTTQGHGRLKPSNPYKKILAGNSTHLLAETTILDINYADFLKFQPGLLTTLETFIYLTNLYIFIPIFHV